MRRLPSWKPTASSVHMSCCPRIGIVEQSGAQVLVLRFLNEFSISLPKCRRGYDRAFQHIRKVRGGQVTERLAATSGPGGQTSGDDDRDPNNLNKIEKDASSQISKIRKFLGIDKSYSDKANVSPIDGRDIAAENDQINATGTSNIAHLGFNAFGDWSRGAEDLEDWDDWSGPPAVPDLDDDDEAAELRESIIERRRARRGRRTKVRDEYLRPIVDATGIYNRLLIGEREAEERVFIESITNQYESREALKFAGILIAVPLTVGFLISRLVAEPLWQYAERLNPQAFALSDEQKVAGADKMHQEEVRLRMEASLGQAPPLTDEAIIKHLHEEAIRYAEKMKDYNRHSLLNIVSDSTAAVSLFLLILPDTSQRAILFRTVGRVFSGLSDTAKAFLIILVTDTLLGYHSEEGWTAALRLLGHHYGWHAPQSGLNLFVATVPVLLDSLFKYWIFVGLNKVDPAAAVTLRQMDRH